MAADDITVLLCGSKFVLPSPGGLSLRCATVGYPALNSKGDKGFVSSAHTFHNIAPGAAVFVEGGGAVTKVGVLECMDEGIDAAFVRLNPDFEVGLCIENTDLHLIGASAPHPLPTDTPVSLYSRVRKKLSAARLKETARDFVEFAFIGPPDAYPTSGDSGGPVFLAEGCSKYALVGVHKAHSAGLTLRCVESCLIESKLNVVFDVNARLK